jgi:hypothetical protein
MTTLRLTTKIGGALADLTSVALSDKPAGGSPTYGIRRTDTGAVVVAAGTPVPNVDTGLYEYEFAAADGVPYEYRMAAVYGGETFITGGSWTERLMPPPATLELSEQDECLLDDVDFFLLEYGEDVIVYPPAGDSRSVTGIVVRSPAGIEKEPRGQATPIALQLPNDAATGISGSEWNNRFEVDVPRYRGGPNVRVRTLKAIHQDAAFITWEVG